MGILNVTPDSFSDGGKYVDVKSALGAARAMLADGADIIDIGGESTRPGAGRVDAATEIARTAEVVAAVAAEGATVSIDTTRSEVAREALRRGASIVNDVSGGAADPAMAAAIAESGCRVVLMHWRDHSADMYGRAVYGDVVAEVSAELRQRAAAMLDAGVAPERVILDPGIGFAKLPEHNWELLSRLDELGALGHPILFGASRKSFLGKLLADADGRPRPVDQREAASLATSVLAFDAGAWGVRVHDVRATADARAVWRATRHTR
jgi:dihydropteroate synthase